jgi:thiol-disulfide isomerase/thioredoxin
MARRRDRLRIRAAATSCLLALLASACSSATPSTGMKGYISGTGAVTVIPPAQRTVAPELRGTDLEGKPIVIRSTGRATVVNIWAAWCGPCRAEADDLARAARRLSWVRFFGVDIRDDSSAASAFVRAFHIPYQSLFDPDGRAVLALHDLVAVQSPPTTLVLDSRGRVAAVVSGQVTLDTLVGLVDDVDRAT